MMRIAFAGNPNSGKTTMYNALTGRNERVGNWAGVTVEKKEGTIKKAYYEGEQLIAVDLPGAYSMSPFTAEESVTSAYVKNEHPDVMINIVDATNLSRSLFFTTQLLELGIPMVVALNKSDINQRRDTKIDQVSDAIQPSHPLSSSSPPAPNPSQHQSFPMIPLLKGNFHHLKLCLTSPLACFLFHSSWKYRI